jgi:hypothetical protein
VRRGLESCGKLASFYDVSRVDADYDDDGDALEDGYDAPIGLCVGAPPSASVMIGRGEHTRRLLMVAANSSWLPEVTMERAAKICTGFVAPSSWSASVIEDYADGWPVLVYPHGVDPAFKPSDESPSGYFRALHLASTHMERKGTKELIHGWADALRALAGCSTTPSSRRPVAIPTSQTATSCRSDSTSRPTTWQRSTVTITWSSSRRAPRVSVWCRWKPEPAACRSS